MNTKKNTVRSAGHGSFATAHPLSADLAQANTDSSTPAVIADRQRARLREQAAYDAAIAAGASESDARRAAARSGWSRP